jgi:hypothetical protein
MEMTLLTLATTIDDVMQAATLRKCTDNGESTQQYCDFGIGQTLCL